MSILTLECTVEHGQIRLPDDLRLPDNARVYVLVPEVRVEGIARVESPRLAHPAEAVDFVMEVRETDAGV